MMDKKHILSGFSGEWDVEQFIRKMKDETSDSFYLCNLSDVMKKYEDWIVKIPRVKPFYAVRILNAKVEKTESWTSSSGEMQRTSRSSQDIGICGMLIWLRFSRGNIQNSFPQRQTQPNHICKHH